MDQEKSLTLWFKDLVMRWIRIFQENIIMIYSGNATLFIVTAMFPFIMLIISVVNLLPGYSTEDVIGVLFRLLPDLEPVKAMVSSIITNLKSQSGGLLASAAAVTTLWSASNGVSAIQKGLNRMDETQEENDTAEEDDEIKEKGKSIVKGILKRLIFTLTLVILIPAMLIFEMLGDSINDVIRTVLEKLAPEGLNSILAKIDSLFQASSLLVIVFALLVVLLLYVVLPNKRRSFKSQLPGALFTSVCWLAFTKLFSFFIPRFYHASKLYGSLASLFLVLLWIRFMVVILFAGGVLNHALEEQKLEKIAVTTENTDTSEKAVTTENTVTPDNTDTPAQEDQNE